MKVVILAGGLGTRISEESLSPDVWLYPLNPCAGLRVQASVHQGDPPGLRYILVDGHLILRRKVKIGDQPILWHIMKTYSHYGFTDFVICCGYKGHIIKEYWTDPIRRNVRPAGCR